jgi:phage terminase large subunit-like protein
MQNVELKADWQDNVKPVKSGRQHNSKIDVVIASIMALGGYVFDHDNVADLTIV